MFLKQSTSVVISFGPFLDKTDGVTLEVGLVAALDHASTGIMLSKNGGTLAVRHAAVTASEYDAHGDYKVTLDTTDTGTIGQLRVIYTDSATCLPVWQDFEVIPAASFAFLREGDVASVADINAEVDTALADINLDHLAKSAVDTDWATTVHASSILGNMASKDAGNNFARATDALEAIADGAFTGPSAPDILSEFENNSPTFNLIDVAVSTRMSGAAITEAAGPLPSTPTPYEVMAQLVLEKRNKLTVVDTGGGGFTKQFYNDAGVAVAKQTGTDDGTTYTINEATTP